MLRVICARGAHNTLEFTNSVAQFQRTWKMTSSTKMEKPFSRFDLPGLNLPLNWQPCEAHEATRWEGEKYIRYSVPATGEGKNLFPTALSDTDVESGDTA
jgi:hypothetical protein